jgi:predicted phosphodiesterase
MSPLMTFESKQRPMKFQLASDLHLEHLSHVFPGERLIVPSKDADILVLAGDIARGAEAVELFKNWPVPVLYIAGNHEFYGGVFESVRADIRKAAKGTNVTFLDDDAMDFEGVRFLGTTLWTDYRLELNRTQRQLMEAADLGIVDSRQIRCATGMFRAEQALVQHELSRAWLERELAKPFDGKTVVISHHGPHRLSVHPRYVGEAVNAAFVSNLSDLLPKVDCWVHGHTHDSFDYSVLGCRVVANPTGYPRNARWVSSAEDLAFENKEVQPACLISV